MKKNSKMYAWDVCQKIIKNQKIEGMYLVIYSTNENWAQKNNTPKKRKKNLLKVWDNYNLSIKKKFYSSKKLTEQEFTKIKTRLKNQEVVSICSQVVKNGKLYHIPIMNFHPDKGFGLREIRVFIQKLFPNKKGFILSSGRYYHYMGIFC